MNLPLVSVICLCYDHEEFVREAIESVLDQSYPNIEIIALDNASRDGSGAILAEIAANNPSVRFLRNTTNMGICKAFNKGWSLAKGDFVIDFATDDVMMPDRIAQQVRHFLTLGPDYGVVFTDAVYIDRAGNIIRSHYEYLKRKGLLMNIPEGDVYDKLLSTYFICSPTMMVRRAVFERLNGYDEDLAYEDFDFWIRSSRLFKYAYLNVTSTKVRRTSGSMSSGWYRKGDPQLLSTYRVCRKAFALNQTEADQKALARRLRYEVRQSIFSENYAEAELFYELLTEVGDKNVLSDLVFSLRKLKLPLAGLRSAYHRMRFGS